MAQFHLLRERRFGPFFAVQFLGAFNDNALKQSIVIYFAPLLSVEQAEIVSQLATALFIAPYFFLSALSGQIAEKTEKSAFIRGVKLLEIGIVLIAVIGFKLKALWVLLIALMLLGAQSTLFGPAKYSLLPQVLRREELIAGNGLVEMGTYIAILTGQIAGAEVVAIPEHGVWLNSLMLLLVAGLGYIAALRIPPLPSLVPDLKIRWNIWSQTIQIIRDAKKEKAVWLSILGISWFWLLGALLMIQLPTFVLSLLGASTSVITLCLIAFSIGVGAGSVSCEFLSRGRIELGLVPFAAILMTLFLIDLFFTTRGYLPPASQIGWKEFFISQSHWSSNLRILFDFSMVGFFGGVYSVPLFALLQSRSKEEERSRTIAAISIFNSVFIVFSAIIAYIFRNFFKLSIPEMFLLAAVLNAIASVYIFSLLPEFLLRFLVWIVTNTAYRLRVEGVENIPEKGAFVLVANHVSYVDAFVLGSAVPRPVRFVMHYRFYEIPILKWLFRWAQVIPIAGKSESQTILENAFSEIKKVLREGNPIGIFPEGALTRTGEIMDFRKGIERIISESPVPVVPVALRGLWGSWFSFEGGAPLKKLPRRFRSTIHVVIGKPIPPEEVEAEKLRLAVAGLYEKESS
ncbi:MAG: MFS transporter [Sandaracinaceae bacterium]|nr:MFS transporter [Sandaracinaceae bacterium]